MSFRDLSWIGPAKQREAAPWPLKIAYFDAIVQPIANKDKAIPHWIGPDNIAPVTPLHREIACMTQD